MQKKVTIETDEQTTRLISKALDVYCRMGLGQFSYLTDVRTIQKNLLDDETYKLQEEFKKQADKLSNIYQGRPEEIGGGSYGVFSDKVGEDCKTAAHVHQQIRHEFYLQQNEEDRKYSGVVAWPADICQIAKIAEPVFKIKIEEIK